VCVCASPIHKHTFMQNHNFIATYLLMKIADLTGLPGSKLQNALSNRNDCEYLLYKTYLHL